MFESAVEKALQFTRPIHTIARNFQSNVILPGAATIFFVNDQGWALTCKHVAQFLTQAQDINALYDSFKSQSAAIDNNSSYSTGRKRDEQRALIKTSGYNRESTAQILNLFLNCIEGQLNCQAIGHERLDLALLKFSNYEKLLCTDFPVFPKDANLRPGKLLCRLGYPFSEFDNFRYDQINDKIEWTKTGRQDSPPFPNEGMVTRLVGDDLGNGQEIVGFDTSTPGLRGQSGGPIFDEKGIVWGVQAQTLHHHLGFDLDTKIFKNGIECPVKHNAFLHVGRAIHVEQIKRFMSKNSVSFQEA